MEFASTLIAFLSVLIALAALGVSVWVGRLASKQAHAAEEQLRAAEVQLQAVKEQVRAAERDLTLTAYANALQDGILGLKATFAAEPRIFEKQVELNPAMREYIPAYMDTKTFLAFAGGMWRLSYVFSVWQRGEDLGLTKAECEGLRKEMLLWLQSVPGFYDIYRSHVSVLEVHNPEFLDFLKKHAYNEKWLEEHSLSTTSASTNAPV